MKNEELVEALENWFQNTLKKEANIYRDPVYICLRDNLSLTGNWKRAPRGDPSKGGYGKAAKRSAAW